MYKLDMSKEVQRWPTAFSCSSHLSFVTATPGIVLENSSSDVGTFTSVLNRGGW